MKKTCKACLREFPLSEFGAQGGARRARCRPCHRVWKRKYREGERKRPMLLGEVPAGPFVAWLNAFVGRIGDQGEAALLLDVNPRQIYRWTKRPLPFIEETTADRLFCNAGEPYLLREFYPQLYGEVAA